MKRPALLLTALLLAAAPAAAQIPERFENLQVLPRDISRDSLMQVMRRFANDLGVRCLHCHVGQEGVANFAGWDFATDHMPAKVTARFMMRMTRDLNERVLAELPERSDPPVRVTCITCHRGLAVPTTIEQVLARTLDSAGVGAAVARYRELRERTMERGRYDFGEAPLIDVARRRLAAGHPADALALLALNAELHPASAGAHLQLAELHREQGRREEALLHYRRVLELEPGNRAAARWVGELAPR